MESCGEPERHSYDSFVSFNEINIGTQRPCRVGPQSDVLALNLRRTLEPRPNLHCHHTALIKRPDQPGHSTGKSGGLSEAWSRKRRLLSALLVCSMCPGTRFRERERQSCGVKRGKGRRHELWKGRRRMSRGGNTRPLAAASSQV